VPVARILDLKSRKVVSWSMKDSLEQTLVQQALVVHEAWAMAVSRRFCVEESKEPVALLFNSDRGSQYAVHGYQKRLQERDITCSMSRRGGRPLGRIGTMPL
jgi:transposase InsO family protein